MPIYVEWLDEQQTILHYRMDDGWNWDDYNAANAYARDLMSKTQHPVDIIWDFTDIVVLPPRMIANFGGSLRKKPHPNRGRVVLVGVSGLLQILWGVVRKLHPEATADFGEALTLDHAIRLLEAPVEAAT